MALTDTFIRQVKPSGKPAGDKHTDGDGMYLLVRPSGKYWRMDYTYMGKRKTLALGVYPAVTLAKARAARAQAREQLPFSLSSNGDGFVFHDATLATGVLESNLALDQFPSPEDLWNRFCAWKGWSPAVRQIAEHSYAPSKTPRYYQLNAINRTVEAIAQGQNRILLVMATGTGKTYTAFQIIWRLWKSGAKKRILYLADRNILIDQTMVNDFRPFKGAMAKLSPNAKGVERVDAETGKQFIEHLDLAVGKTGKLVDKSYEIYLSLYQAVSGTEEEENIYKQFSPDFFDLTSRKVG